MKAIEQDVARKIMTKKELFEKVSKMIKRAQEETKVLMDAGIIRTLPPLKLSTVCSA